MNKGNFRIKVTLLEVLLLISSCTFAKTDSNKKVVRFGITADSHYADRNTNGTRYYRQSIRKMNEFTEVMNREQVDFVIHLGDIKDEVPQEKTENTLEHLKEIEHAYTRFNGPKYHCIGNHDIDNISKQEFLDHIENTGIDSNKGYYSFNTKAYHFVVLDPNFHTDGRDHNNGDFEWFESFIPENQLKWLENDLKNTTKPSIIFSHFTLFEFIRDNAPYHVSNYKEVQKIMEKSGKVIAVFQGHVHEEQFRTINHIHYITLNGMVDYEGLNNNSFDLVEISPNKLTLKGFHRASDRTLMLKTIVR